MIEENDWRFGGACQNHPDIDWFPPDAGKAKGRPKFDRYAAPRAVCLTCPIALVCAEEGLHEQMGMWGGLDPNERKRLKRVLRDTGMDFPDAYEAIARRGIFA